MSVWLDVTTILGWTRPAVGIVRVECECARHFLDHAGPDVRFCRFELAARAYSEVGAAEVRDAVRRITLGEKEEAVASLEIASVRAAPPTDEAPTKRRRTPRERILRTLGFARGETAGPASAEPKRDEATSRDVETGSGGRAPIFGPDDVYVSVGLDWDQKDLGYLDELKRRIGFRVVLFCHDTIPVRLPHLCVPHVASGFSAYLANLSWCADVVLCNSECTRRDLASLLTRLGAPVPDLRVVRLGTEVGSGDETDLSPAVKALPVGGFVLFVSTIERRKNHEAIYRAYARLVDAGRRELPPVVFVGMRGWGVEGLLNDIELDPRTKGLVHVMDHVSDADLAALYRRCMFTVYPSLYEGWGLPVAESLAYGKLCIASNAASIPEIGGDLVEYVEPWNVVGWAERLAHYFDHPGAIAEREQAIRDRHRIPSWDETGASVLGAARSVVRT